MSNWLIAIAIPAAFLFGGLPVKTYEPGPPVVHKEDKLAMPMAIVYLWEDERPAEEGPMPSDKAYELALQIYDGAGPEVFVAGPDTERYFIALRQWMDEGRHDLSPEERETVVARLEAAIQ